VQGSGGRCVFLEPPSNPPGYWIKARGPAAPAPAAAGLAARLRRQPLLRRLERGLMRGSRWPQGGLEHEIAEVERCLATGLAESPLVPLARSVRGLGILGEVAALAARP